MKGSSRLQRLLQLTALLQGGQILNADSLAHRQGVSRRTVFRDLQTLNHAGLAVLFDEQRDGYFLPSPWRLPVEPLNTAEATSLLLVCQELGRAQGGVPFHAAAQSAAVKIGRSLPLALQELAAEAIEGMEIRLDPMNPLLAASSHYEAILDAWIQRRQVRIEYESATDQRRISTLFCPYRLFFSRRSWYVVGRSSVDREVRLYNLGRMVSIQLMDGNYRIPRGFSLDRYLGDAWHLIRDASQRHEIVILFQPMVARNVAEVRWHRTQQSRWRDDGRLEFRVTVDGLNEIAWWILGYGDQAEVVSPPALREKIMQVIERMRQVYAGKPPTAS